MLEDQADWGGWSVRDRWAVWTLSVALCGPGKKMVWSLGGIFWYPPSRKTPSDALAVLGDTLRDFWPTPPAPWRLDLPAKAACIFTSQAREGDRDKRQRELKPPYRHLGRRLPTRLPINSALCLLGANDSTVSTAGSRFSSSFWLLRTVSGTSVPARPKAEGACNGSA